MSVAWLEELLPAAMLSPRTKILWILFFMLFPLAYVGAVMLQLAEDSPARIADALDRTGVIQRAQEFAEAKGFGVAGWQQFTTAETTETLVAYYRDSKQSEIAALSALAPGRDVQVLFRSPDHTHECRVFLSLSGKVTGYDFGKSTMEKRSSVDFGGVLINQKPSDSENERASDNQSAQSENDKDAEKLARQVLAANASEPVSTTRPSESERQCGRSGAA